MIGTFKERNVSLSTQRIKRLFFPSGHEWRSLQLWELPCASLHMGEESLPEKIKSETKTESHCLSPRLSHAQEFLYCWVTRTIKIICFFELDYLLSIKCHDYTDTTVLRYSSHILKLLIILIPIIEHLSVCMLFFNENYIKRKLLTISY